MGRLIQTERAGTERNRLVKSVVAALRELANGVEVNSQTRDAAAYIGLALLEINDTVEKTVQAWEKRDYWVKADRFRMEWRWAGELGERMVASLRQEDWGSVAVTSARIGEKLKSVELAPNHRLGRPWVGAWEKFIEKSGHYT